MGRDEDRMTSLSGAYFSTGVGYLEPYVTGSYTESPSRFGTNENLVALPAGTPVNQGLGLGAVKQEILDRFCDHRIGDGSY